MGRGNPAEVTYIEALLGEPCAYCQEFGCDTLDHIIPLSQPGSQTVWSNLAPAHVECNRAKGSSGLLMFLVS